MSLTPDQDRREPTEETGAKGNVPRPRDAAACDAIAAITSRRSIRAFLPTPVARETIERILAVASRAPSGTNTQPWHVYVLSGESLGALSRRLVAAYDDPEERARHSEEYAYYPTEWKSAVHRAAPQGRLGSLRPARHRQDRQGADARAAPAQLRVLRRAVGADCHDRPRHAPGQLARLRHVPAERDGRARARTALDTCPQAAFTPFHRIITEQIGAPARRAARSAACRSAVADPDAIENTLVTEREPSRSFARFLD
jgi:hypothetical protein